MSYSPVLPDECTTLCLFIGPNIGSCTPTISISGLLADTPYAFEVVNLRGQHIRYDATADFFGQADIDVSTLLPQIGELLTVYMVDAPTGTVVPMYFEDCGVCGPYLGFTLTVIAVFGEIECNVITCA